MNITEERKPRTLIFNPFVYIAGGQALVIGLVAIILTGLIGSVSRTHFDGVLDVHPGQGHHFPVWIFLSEGFVDWVSLALVLLITGRILSKTPFRTIDMIGTQAMARWPTLLISLISLPPGIQRFNNHVLEQIKQGKLENLQLGGSDAGVFYTCIIAIIPLWVWTIVLLYKSFSVSCNLKGAKGIWSFIIGVIIAEIISKLALAGIFKIAGV